MAQRPIFLPQNTQPFSREVNIEFQWFGGFARSQQQKCIASLHDEANAREFGPTLEISSRSPTPLGVALSAFNLKVRIGGLPEATVEAVFQCSKVFASCGPFPEFLGMSGRDIKRDPRLRGSGPLKRFQLGDEEWRLSPKTALYDWIYVRALVQNSELSSQICGYNSFSDIAFNPERSLNCQARSAALFVALTKFGNLEKCLTGQRDFLREVYGVQTGESAKTFQASLEFGNSDGETASKTPSNSTVEPRVAQPGAPRPENTVDPD